MRSLYFGVVVVLLSILLLSFAMFRVISDRIVKTYFNPVFESMDELELEDARSIFEKEGSAGVAAYMEKLNRLFGGAHYLLDAHGTDVVSGANRAALLTGVQSSKSRGELNGQVVVTHGAVDGRYWFAVVAPFSGSADWTMYPYYALVAFVAGLLCWLVAAGVISPIRRIAHTVASFGGGDLSARIASRRSDEIGQLAASFDQTADRLQRLIVTERRLLEDVSHELRSPLTRLKCAIRIAQTSPAQSAVLEQIERDVDRMTSLVADIVQITRIEGDPTTGQMLPVDIAGLANEVVEDCLIEARARNCGIKLTGTISREVVGDRELLRRAIENVLRNAIRYAPESSTIDVDLSGTATMANVAIRDFGSGVPGDYLPRIFDPFFRVEDARDKVSGGAGLGLSIARRAVELHHGAIVAENAHPGLRVVIAIPLVETSIQTR